MLTITARKDCRLMRLASFLSIGALESTRVSNDFHTYYSWSFFPKANWTFAISRTQDGTYIFMVNVPKKIMMYFIRRCESIELYAPLQRKCMVFFP